MIQESRLYWISRIKIQDTIVSLVLDIQDKDS